MSSLWTWFYKKIESVDCTQYDHPKVSQEHYSNSLNLSNVPFTMSI